MSIKSVMPSNHLICHPFLLPSIFPSIRVFSSEPALCIRWSNYWSFRFGISPSKVYSMLISLRINWFELLAAQGTLNSLCQHHSSKTLIHWRLAFFMVQLSHLYMTTGKTIALTIQTFVSQMLSLFFNMLSRFVMAFLPRWDFPGGSDGKASVYNAEDLGSIPGRGRFPGEGNSTHSSTLA